MNNQPAGKQRKAVARLCLVLLLSTLACARSTHRIPNWTAELVLAPEPTAEPTATPITEIVEETEEPEMPVRITIVYNNIAGSPDLQTDWGFGAYIEYGENVVLFDTGTKGAILLSNMEKLGLDPARVRYLVLSHLHQDHIGGVEALLQTGVQPHTYVLSNFPGSFQSSLSNRTEMTVVEETIEILPGVHTTGPVSGNIIEQGLVLETAKGLVVITGCAHPGVHNIVRQAVESVEGQVYLVLGGFHLSSASYEAVDAIIADLRAMGVQNVAPSHCTGTRSISQFEDAFGDHFFPSGVGTVFELDG